MRECDEDGCWATAEPDGPMFQVGNPPGDITYMRRFRCGAGHRYFLDIYKPGGRMVRVGQPSQTLEHMILQSSSRPEDDALLERSRICAQTVRWGEQDLGPGCWAHGPHSFSPQADCMQADHGCNQLGTGRLGLCAAHEAEVFG